jgi:hypothetical protein
LGVLGIPDEFTGRRTARATMGRGRRFLLAPYVVAEAIETLIEAAPAETGWLGIGLRAGTLVICPWVGFIKQRVTEKLGTRATRDFRVGSTGWSASGTSLLTGPASTTVSKIFGWPSRPWVTPPYAHRRGFLEALSNPGISKIEFAADSPLEGGGFEPLVPLKCCRQFEATPVDFFWPDLSAKKRTYFVIGDEQLSMIVSEKSIVNVSC